MQSYRILPISSTDCLCLLRDDCTEVRLHRILHSNVQELLGDSLMEVCCNSLDEKVVAVLF